MLLCQIAAVRARMRCMTRIVTPAMVRPPWASRSSWPLSVSLTDSMICRRGLKSSVPGWAGREGNVPGRFALTCRSHRRSEVNPSRACITANVTNSASEIRGAIPTHGRHGVISGWDFQRSSVLTYSAVARVSRSLSSRAFRFEIGVFISILDTPPQRTDQRHPLESMT